MSSLLASTVLGKHSVGEEVIAAYGVDLTGKNVVVTGASGGIGAESARVLANAGARVFALGRNEAKTQSVVDSINGECGDPARVSFVQCDLSSLASVKQAAAVIKAAEVPIHIMLNNAGVMAIPERTETQDGIEMQFGTNHVAHFLLTQELTDALKAGAPARVVNVSSKAHWRGDVKFDDIMLVQAYEGWRSYGQSKTANILHAMELSKRFEADGIMAVSLHPGVIASDLWRHTDTRFPPNKTIPQGASTSIYCCVSPDVVGGGFYEDCAPARRAPYAADPAFADRLWTVSEELIASKM